MNPTLTAGLAMAALLVLVLAVATRPWWRRATGGTQSRRAANVAAFRLRLAEIDAEVAAGLTPAGEAAGLRAELEARLLADASDSESAPVSGAARRPLATGFAVAFVALFAAGGYVVSGSWRVQQQIAQAERKPALDPQIVAMVGKLAERLQANPDDLQGWSMLGRSYFVMQRYGDAAKAYAEFNARTPAPDAEALADEGEALAFANDGEVSGAAVEKIEAALKVDPGFAKALWYGGLGAAQAGDFALARQRWEQLAKRDDLPAPMRSALEDRLKVLASVEADDAGSGATPSASAAAPGAPLKLRVVLAPELVGAIPPGATLFVFAKAASGPQMPLAVQRIAEPKLPLELSLDDSMAMAPALRLSQFERVVVTARLSAAGTAQAASGDLEGHIETGRAKAGDPMLTLIIDRRVP